jgi:hypothetical protein
LNDDDDCALANGTFYSPSTTKDECLSKNYCWSVDSIVTGLLVEPNERGECSEGEVLKSLFEWRDAQWIGGTWAYSQWTKRASVKANVMKATIHFPHLQKNISFPSSLSAKTFLQNQVLED